MKTIKVSFDFEEKHYKFVAKLKWENHGYVLTSHKSNEELDITYYDGEYHVQQWEGDTGTVEVVLKADISGTEIRNVILWGDIDAPALAMKGEFDNYKESILGCY